MHTGGHGERFSIVVSLQPEASTVGDNTSTALAGSVDQFLNRLLQKSFSTKLHSQPLDLVADNLPMTTSAAKTGFICPKTGFVCPKNGFVAKMLDVCQQKFDFLPEIVCNHPEVVNGDVTAVTESSNIFVGSVTCNEGYTLVGKTRIKCVNGIWSSSTPVCTRKKILF